MSDKKSIDDSKLKVYVEGCNKILNKISVLYSYRIEDIYASFESSGFPVSFSDLSYIYKEMERLFNEFKTQIKNVELTIQDIINSRKKAVTDLSKYPDDEYVAYLIWTGVFNYNGIERVNFLGNRYKGVQEILNKWASGQAVPDYNKFKNYKGTGTTGGTKTTKGTEQPKKITEKVEKKKITPTTPEQKKETTPTIPKKQEEPTKTTPTPEQKKKTTPTIPKQQEEPTKTPTTPEQKKETTPTIPKQQEEPTKTPTTPEQKKETTPTIEIKREEPTKTTPTQQQTQTQPVQPQPTETISIHPQPAQQQPQTGVSNNSSNQTNTSNGGVNPTVNVAPSQAATTDTGMKSETESIDTKVDFTAGNKKTTTDITGGELPNPNASSDSKTTFTSSGGGFNPVPIAVGLGAAVAGGIGVKAIHDHRKNAKFDDQNEDSVTNGNRFWTDDEPNVINSEQNYNTGEELFNTDADTSTTSYQATENTTPGDDTWSIEENEIADNNTFDLLSGNN